MIKALFFDIDGTLVSFNTHRIPDSALNALYALKDKGYKLFIASGRPYKHLELLPNELTEFPWDGMVLFNGQYCLDANKNVVRDQPIPQSALESLMPYLRQHPEYIITFCELEYEYDSRFNEEHFQYLKSIGREDQMHAVEDIERCLTHPTYQICPRVDESLDEEFVRNAPGIKSARWTPDFADLIPEDGGKPEGIKQLLTSYGLTADECMAFGDGGNDISMLEFARIGVAMGNAKDEVKARADYVTDDIDQDGLLKAFQHFDLL